LIPLLVPFCSHARTPRFPQLLAKNGGDDGTRTRDLCRDSGEGNHWRKQNQQVTRAVVGNRWLRRAVLGNFVIRIVIRRGWSHELQS
jgi:hypothetical protein